VKALNRKERKGANLGSDAVYKEASQTRDYSVAKNALRRASLTQGRLQAVRAARPDLSLRKIGLLGMTIKLHRYQGAKRESELTH
jgi:hypothetical protein